MKGNNVTEVTTCHHTTSRRITLQNQIHFIDILPESAYK